MGEVGVGGGYMGQELRTIHILNNTRWAIGLLRICVNVISHLKLAINIAMLCNIRAADSFMI